jgi:hypothetical protein
LDGGLRGAGRRVDPLVRRAGVRDPDPPVERDEPPRPEPARLTAEFGVVRPAMHPRYREDVID